VGEIIVSGIIVLVWSPYLWALHRKTVPARARAMSKHKGE
jgi:hypothetical protein